MAMPSDQEFAPTQIARAVFPTAFRGYDQDAVRRYLSRLASALEHQQEYTGLGELEARTPAHERVEELETEVEDLRQEIRDLELELVQRSVAGAEATSEQAAKPASEPAAEPTAESVPFDEHRAIELLGKETARVLESARSAAADILKRAETQAASLKSQAKSELAEARRRADTVLSGAQAEADELTLRLTTEAEAEARRISLEADDERAAAAEESGRIVADATTKAESTRAVAEDRAIQIVADAETLRQQVMSELVADRREAQQDMERIKAARDRLAMSLAVARSELDEVADALVGVTVSHDDVPSVPPPPDDHSHQEEVDALIGELDAASPDRSGSTGASPGDGDNQSGGGGTKGDTAESAGTTPAKKSRSRSKNSPGPATAGSTKPDSTPNETKKAEPKTAAGNKAAKKAAGVKGGRKQAAGNKRAGGKPAGSKATADKDTADKDTADKATADKDTVDKATADKATTGKDTAGRAGGKKTAAKGGPASISGDDRKLGTEDRSEQQDDDLVSVIDLTNDGPEQEVPVGQVELNKLPADGEALSLVEGFTTIDLNEPPSSTDGDVGGDGDGGGERVPAATAVSPRDEAEEVEPVNPALVHSVVINEPQIPEDVITTVVSRTTTASADRTQGDLLVERPFTGRLPNEFSARDAALTRCGPNFRRQLRRALNDDQSDVLDRLRGGRGPISADELPDFDEQIERYHAPLRRGLSEIAQAGAKVGGQADLSHAALDNLVRQLARYIVDRVRTPTIEILDQDSASDRERILEPIRALYRDFRNVGLPDLSEDALYEAFAIGLYDSIEPSAPVAWILDPRSDPDPVCDINSRKRDVVKGGTFPSGHARPLSLPGCRCLVAAVED